MELEVYNETTCHPGSVNKELELCVGGRLDQPAVGVYAKGSDGKYEFQERTGGEPFDFIGYKVRNTHAQIA